MKKLMLFTIVFAVVLSGCNKKVKLERQVQNIDSIKPKVNIKVKKEYDDKGNLISIDSTYTYFYSNIKNDSILEKEIFNNFKFDFNNQFKSLDSLIMKDFLKESPFQLQDFYTDDFFENNFNFHHKRIENLFKQMDSIKNNFYKKQNEFMQKT